MKHIQKFENFISEVKGSDTSANRSSTSKPPLTSVRNVSKEITDYILTTEDFTKEHLKHILAGGIKRVEDLSGQDLSVARIAVEKLIDANRIKNVNELNVRIFEEVKKILDL